MAGCNLEVEARSLLNRIENLLVFSVCLSRGLGIAVVARVDFDRIRIHPLRSFDLISSWVNEETDDDASLSEALNGLLQGLKEFQHIETPFRRQFFPLL